MKSRNIILLSLFLMNILCCHDANFFPKPTGFFRIDLPKKEYITFSDRCPYSFEYPIYGVVENNEKDSLTYCFKTITFPQFNANLYLSYAQLGELMPLRNLTEETRSAAVEHEVKASAITNSVYVNDSTKVYAQFYSIEGNTASNMVFYCTDSTNHYLHGNLMFWASPNYDSLLPVLTFLREDIHHIVESMKWNNETAK